MPPPPPSTPPPYSDSTLGGVCLSLSSDCPPYHHRHHHLAAGLTIISDYRPNKPQITGSRVTESQLMPMILHCRQSDH